jgi:flagellar basal body-associated protein FliL
MFVFVPAKGADRKQNLFILLIIMIFFFFCFLAIYCFTNHFLFPPSLCNLFAVKREEPRLEVVKTLNAVTPMVWGDIVCQSL